MAVEESAFVLPNLRIEIDNDFVEDMDTDVLSDSKKSPANVPEEDFEDGELSDSQDSDKPRNRKAGGELPMEMPFELPDREKRYENKGGGFVTGVDIFGEEEQNKLGVRAKRFGLDSSKLKPLTEQELDKLYESVGVNNEEESSEKKQFRLNALHMRGTEDLSTEDIFSYFKAYGPASIEWINDYSCNVVWLDNASAARALLGLSRPVKGLEKSGVVGRDSPTPVLDKEIISDGTQDVVVVVTHEDDEDDDVTMGDSSDKRQEEQSTEKVETNPKNDESVVDVSSITIPIPPGKWRIGVTHPKARNILLRFSTRSDKKHPRAEKLSQYYKKYGNPNYGGIVGILTESRKRRFRRNEHRPQARQLDADDNSDEFSGSLHQTKNPWGDLAKEWSGVKQMPEEYQVTNTVRDRPILDRIGALTTRPQNAESTGSQSEDSEAEAERLTRSKVPRMRMYADDEQAKVEKRRAQQKIKLRDDNSDDERSSSSVIRDDLRHKLRREGRNTVEDKIHSALRLASSVPRRRDVREPSLEDEGDSADGSPSQNYRDRSASSERDYVSRSGTSSRDKAETPNITPRLSSSVQRTQLSVTQRLSSTVHRNLPSDAQRFTSSGQRNEPRAGHRYRAEMRSPPRISSTVWSRLRHGQTYDNSLSEDEDYEVDRRRKNTPESDVHSECDSDEPVVQRKKLEMGFAGDLRSKLNSKKTMNQLTMNREPEEPQVRPKSPLQIEIDNDEYYRLIGTSDSDNE